MGPILAKHLSEFRDFDPLGKSPWLVIMEWVKKIIHACNEAEARIAELEAELAKESRS